MIPRRYLVGFTGIVGYLIGVQGVLILMRYLTFGSVSPSASNAQAGTALAANTALIGLFVSHHHLFACTPVKAWIERHWPGSLERSLYVGISGSLLYLLCTRFEPVSLPFLGESVWELRGSVWAHPIWLAYGLGWICAASAALVLNQFELFGLLGALQELRGKPVPEAKLVQHGPYGLIRHPMYAGFIIACWATPSMDAARLLLASGLTLYAIGGSYHEERKLLSQYGSAYRSYRSRVPRWIPALRSGV